MNKKKKHLDTSQTPTIRTPHSSSEVAYTSQSSIVDHCLSTNNNQKHVLIVNTQKPQQVVVTSSPADCHHHHHHQVVTSATQHGNNNAKSYPCVPVIVTSGQPSSSTNSVMRTTVVKTATAQPVLAPPTVVVHSNSNKSCDQVTTSSTTHSDRVVGTSSSLATNNTTGGAFSNKYAIKHKANRYVSGAIGILETSLNGEYIILENLSSNKVVNLKGWYIHKYVPDQAINVIYKFTDDIQLCSGEKLKIVARGGTSKHQRSSSVHEGMNGAKFSTAAACGNEKVLIAHNVDNWGTYSKYSVTKLINPDGVDKAVLTQSLLRLASSSNNVNACGADDLQSPLPHLPQPPPPQAQSPHVMHVHHQHANNHHFQQQQTQPSHSEIQRRLKVKHLLFEF